MNKVGQELLDEKKKLNEMILAAEDISNPDSAVYKQSTKVDILILRQMRESK